MTLTELVTIFEQVLGTAIDINPDTPIMESGLNLDSLTILNLFAAIEQALGTNFSEEDAFEIFSLSMNQIISRYS